DRCFLASERPLLSSDTETITRQERPTGASQPCVGPARAGVPLSRRAADLLAHPPSAVDSRRHESIHCHHLSESSVRIPAAAAPCPGFARQPGPWPRGTDCAKLSEAVLAVASETTYRG